MHTIMRKKPELTAVCVDEIPASRWSIGSQIMGDRGVATASVIIHVTAGTNTADEKAQMIRATFQLLQAVLGSMAEASYVIIHELPAEAWGYGGQTQKARQAIKVA
jgi:4-oxalocrotonate tautomerase